MPGSSVDIMNDVAESIIRNTNSKKFLDIGAGAGKYGKMIRQLVPEAHITGIEIEQDYIIKYKLNELYDEMLCMPAHELIDKKTDEIYDLAIIGDSLEHMKKSNGIDLINFLIYRVRYLLIIYPVEYLQPSLQGYKHEAHISYWNVNDFNGLNGKGVMRGYMMAIGFNGYRWRPQYRPDIKTLIPEK